MAHTRCIDDDADAMPLEEALLGGRGARRSTGPDGVAALKWLRDPALPRPDLIVLDWNMPRMDRREFLKLAKPTKTSRPFPLWC
ncbi:hypothetical protein [Streptodolium elevatio]|uniref:Response regulatory domain-containing protein n=1 Tax=Streptodolium elevatio TaxID=3157996 RepID=A0ABV3DKQ8_9ACTN